MKTTARSRSLFQSLFRAASEVNTPPLESFTEPNVTNLRGTLEFAESPNHGFDVFMAEDF